MVKHDDFGPEKIISVYHPKLNLFGWVVVDNTGLGPGKGGIRVTSSVDLNEVCKLARTMTWKNAMAELPFGGAKAGIQFDVKKGSVEKVEVIREFAKAVKFACPSVYVAGPDINTTEKEMAVFAEENGNSSCTGKPKEKGGLPHELGSTGFGVFHATLLGLKKLNIEVNNVRVAVEGFGNVGYFVTKFLSEAGAKIVAVSDSKGVVFNNEGISFSELERVKKATGSVTNYKPGTITSDVLAVDADVLVTAAIPDLVKESDVSRLKFRLVVEGSNIPMSQKTEEMLHKRGVLVIPDFVANAGGVISSYVEYINGSEADMWKLVEEKIKNNTQLVLNGTAPKRSPRKVAIKIAEERVRAKCSSCRS